MRHRYKVLFLCTGNSARSILAEYILRARAGDRFETYSAGMAPRGAVHPQALAVLAEQFQIDASDARSKSWREFEGVHFDFVITVCDKAREACPSFPGQPVTAHWSSPDPAEFLGTPAATLRAFVDVAQQINARLNILTAFRDEQLDAFALDSIGRQHRHGQPHSQR